jgi:uncharacterized protein YlxP (DUF503 family)
MSKNSRTAVGVLTVQVLLAEGSSLKDKRRVLKSLLQRIRQRFNISAAEVGDLDKWRSSVLGFAVVSNDGTQCNRVLDSVLDALEAEPEIEVGGMELEIL